MSGACGANHSAQGEPSGDEVRDMIGQALRGEPPVGIDYGAVRAAGRRRLARRNLGIASAAVLGVVAVAGVAVTLGQLAASPDPTGGTGAPATSSAARPAPVGCVMPAGQGGFGDLSDGVASAEELAESARLTEAFGRFAVPLPAGVTMEPAKPRLCAIADSWGTTFTLRSPAGEREVLLEVRPRNGQPPGECARFGGQVDCSVLLTPDGGQGRVTVTPPFDPNHPSLVNVELWRADDTVVRLLETGSTGPAPTPRILGREELSAIVMAPELRVRWAGTPGQSPRPAEPSDRRAAQLSALFNAAYRLPAGMRAEKVPHARAEAMDFYVSQGGYKLDATLVDAAGRGNLFINLNPPAAGIPVECGGEPNCEVITLPDGRKATWSRQTAGGVTTLALGTMAADGTSVTVMSSNQAGEAPGRTRAQPPLGRDDLVQIASVAQLSW